MRIVAMALMAREMDQKVRVMLAVPKIACDVTPRSTRKMTPITISPKQDYQLYRPVVVIVTNTH